LNTRDTITYDSKEYLVRGRGERDFIFIVRAKTAKEALDKVFRVCTSNKGCDFNIKSLDSLHKENGSIIPINS
jgi:hypothetical protein